MEPTRENRGNEPEGMSSWLVYAGDAVALAAAVRTLFSGRYSLDKDGVQAGAKAALLSWLLPSFAARGAVSYIPKDVPYSNAIKGVVSLFTASVISKKICPHVCYLLYARHKLANWGKLGQLASYSSAAIRAVTGKKIV